MKDAGVICALRGLLRCLKKSEGEAYRANVGADYSDIVDAFFRRMTWPSDKRSLSQNAKLHAMFGDIAKQSEDMSAQDVKGECHRDIGLNIRLRDPQFEWVWRQTGARLDREKQAILLASECLGLSSGMTSKELKEYIDQIEREYSRRGVQFNNEVMA